MEGTELSEAILNGANLSEARGGQANFINTSFVNANLSRAEMYQCSFNGANFSHAILRDAFVNYSSFDGANFTNADLRSVEGFYNIRKAIFCNTIMPDESVWYDSIGY